MDEDLQSALKNMMKLESIQHVSHVRVDITALQLSPDYGVQCRDQNFDFIEKDNTNCSLPFDIGNDKPICNEYGQGLEAIKSKLNQIKNHLRYCLQLKIIYNQEQTNFLITSVRPQYVNMFLKDSEDERSYIFELPKFAKLISYKNEYSLPTALAYFGSVAGIFLGISVISLSTLVLNYKNWKIEIMKWSLIITKIGMSIYLLTIFILLVKKFLEYPRGTSVNFAETTSDFSMTICSSLQIYGVVVEYINYTTLEGKPYHTSNTFVSHDMFLMTNKSLWQKWSDPRNIIDSLKANTGSNEIDLLGENFTTLFSFLPIDNETVAACHTFQMTKIKEIDSLTLIYNEEVQVYFHNTGQLLYEWDKKQNLILPATKENVQKNENILNVYNTAVILKMERQLKLDEEGGQSYDECVIDYGREALGVNPMKCFFSKGYNNCTDIISNSFLTNVRNLLQSQNKCALPTNILLTSADKSVSLYRVVIKTDDMDLPEYDATGSLGIKDNSQGRKPKIEFFLPKFTKLSQVSQL